MTVSVNGVDVTVAPDSSPELAAARELLRQQAVMRGFLAADVADEPAIDHAIEALLASEVTTPSPTDNECRRYYETHPREFQSGDLVHARHILFQVTSQISVPDLRARAEETLNTLLRQPDRFEALAREVSNCPSGQQGGNLGQIGRGDTVPEFEKALFRLGATGILPELVKTRYGFHIVAIDQSIPGEKLLFAAVRHQIAQRLRSSVEQKAVRQYISMLAGGAKIEGAQLEASASPLVQ